MSPMQHDDLPCGAMLMIAASQCSRVRGALIKRISRDLPDEMTVAFRTVTA